jgi:aspartate aminotransferase
MSGIKLVPILLRIENNFLLTNKKFIENKITKKTKAIVIINPDNPTGKLWNSSELEMILSVAKKHNLFVISDETYREIRFDNKKPICLLGNKTFLERVIVCDSISKRFSIPGARLGCIVSFNIEIMQSVLKFAQARLSVPTLEQFAANKIIANSSGYVNKIVKEYKQRRKVLIYELGKIEGVKFLPSQGAFYQSVSLPVKSAEEFVKFLISDFSYKKQTVMVTPMQDFYISKGMGANEIRIAYVINSKDLKVAIDILGRGLKAFLEKSWG